MMMSSTSSRAASDSSAKKHGASATGDRPEALSRIITAFRAVPDPMQRYKQLLFFASRLPPLEPALKCDDNKDGRVYYSADSDSQLTKGLAALLVEGLSGSRPEEVLNVSPEFINELGLKQSLTPSRNNGFLNMLKMVQRKTAALL